MMQQTQVSGGVKTVAWLQKIQINQRVFDFLVAEFGQFKPNAPSSGQVAISSR